MIENYITTRYIYDYYNKNKLNTVRCGISSIDDIT